MRRLSVTAHGPAHQGPAQPEVLDESGCCLAAVKTMAASGAPCQRRRQRQRSCRCPCKSPAGGGRCPGGGLGAAAVSGGTGSGRTAAFRRITPAAGPCLAGGALPHVARDHRDMLLFIKPHSAVSSMLNHASQHAMPLLTLPASVVLVRLASHVLACLARACPPDCSAMFMRN